MARRLIPTHRSTTLLQAITRREWRFLSALAWQWERLGAEAGVTTPDGVVEITTSTSITTTTSLTTRTGRTSATAIVLLNSPIAEEAATGSTIRSTGVELPTETRPRQISTAAQAVGLPLRTVNQMRGNNNLVSRAVDSRPARQIEAAPAEADNKRVPAIVQLGVVAAVG